MYLFCFSSLYYSTFFWFVVAKFLLFLKDFLYLVQDATTVIHLCLLLM